MRNLQDNRRGVGRRDRELIFRICFLAGVRFDQSFFLHPLDPLLVGQSTLREQVRIAQIQMNVTRDVSVSLVSSRSPTHTEIGDMFSAVFNYGDVMGRSGVYAGFEFLRDLLSIVLVQHFRFFE